MITNSDEKGIPVTRDGIMILLAGLKSEQKEISGKIHKNFSEEQKFTVRKNHLKELVYECEIRLAAINNAKKLISAKIVLAPLRQKRTKGKLMD